MTLTDFQRANIRGHLHTDDQIRDSESGEQATSGLDEAAHDALDHAGLPGVPSTTGLLNEASHDALNHAGLPGVPAELGVWTNYTPTWSTMGAGADPTIGNGTLVGRYKMLDAVTMVLNLYLVWGTTSTGGSGDWVFNLPGGFTAAGGRQQVLAGEILDQGADRKTCVAFIDGLGSGFVVVPEGSNVAHATAPMTWADTDNLVLGGILEVVAP